MSFSIVCRDDPLLSFINVIVSPYDSASVAGNCGAEPRSAQSLPFIRCESTSDSGLYWSEGANIKNESCPEYHGKDGFGDVPDAVPTVAVTDYSNIKPNRAPLKLIELIQVNPGEVDLLAIG